VVEFAVDGLEDRDALGTRERLAAGLAQTVGAAVVQWAAHHGHVLLLGGELERVDSGLDVVDRDLHGIGARPFVRVAVLYQIE
jgi:hypothetical protein